MKNNSLIIALLLSANLLFGQTPDKISYQAVLRNSANEIIKNQLVGVQVSMLKGSASGAAVYVETMKATTNVNGLISLEIGTGTVLQGIFAAINWADGPYFIKTETDLKGGTTYTITGISQLLSVPYALHARTADRLTGGGTGMDATSLQGRSISNGLPAKGQVLKFNGTTWTPGFDSIGNVNSVNATQLQGKNIATTVPANGWILRWNGTAWTPAPDTASTAMPVLRVSKNGDSLLLGKQYVLIAGVSASNSGTQFANAGPDRNNTCTATTSLAANTPTSPATGLWTIVSGTGGTIASPTNANSTFTGTAGQVYNLRWRITNAGVINDDFVQLSFASNFTVTTANAGPDQLDLNTQTVTITANAAGAGETGVWTIVSGTGGILGNAYQTTTSFYGLPGATYTLRYTISSACAISQDQVTLSFSSSASSVVSAKGCYYIPDAAFRNVLQILHPTAMKGDSLILSAAGSIRKLKVVGQNISNMDGLQYLTKLDTLYCGRNLFKSLPALPSALKYLDCSGNNNVNSNERQLTSLPALPASLTYLSCSDNKLTSLPALPASLTTLECRSNQLTSLPDMSASLINLDCRTNQLTSLPALPASLTTLSCYSNQLTSLPALPASLTYLSCQSNQLTSLPDMSGNMKLTYISAFSNKIVKLAALPNNSGSNSINIDQSVICVTNKPASWASSLTTFDVCP